MKKTMGLNNEIVRKTTGAIFFTIILGISCTKELSYEGPAPHGPYSIFADQAPAGKTFNDMQGTGIELGLRFRSATNGYIQGIKFFKTPGNIGTHSAQLFSFDGTLLTSAVFVNETDSGWQTALFSSAIPIAANTTYIAAYFSSQGYYVATNFGLNTAVSNGPLTALADGADGTNGLYKYTGTPAFPGLGHLSNNYWVDVIETDNPAF